MLEKIEQQKAEALRLIEGWSEARLAYRLAANAWSTSDVFDHIVKTERGILAAARKGLRTPHHIGIRDRLGFLFLDRLFQSKRKVKVPASATHVLPNSSVDLAVVLRSWDKARKDLARLLTEISPDQFRAGVFRHPVSGWMSLPQIVSFFSVHLLHHGYQLTRLRKASEHL